MIINILYKTTLFEIINIALLINKTIEESDIKMCVGSQAENVNYCVFRFSIRLRKSIKGNISIIIHRRNV